MSSFYKLKKDSFMWKKGAIISNQSNSNKYRQIEDIWNKVPLDDEYISCSIIEHKNNTDFFQRVYPDTITGRFFKTKDQLLKSYDSAFNS